MVKWRQMCVLGKWAALNKARWLCAFAMLPFANFAQANCPETDFIISGSWGDAAFKVALARTPEQRNRGLMFVTDLPDQSGMLFVYPNPQSVSFWMKNTPLGLDMLFIDEGGIVQRVKHSATPFSTELIDGGSDIQYVLEVAAGSAAKYGISKGIAARILALDPTPIHVVTVSNSFWPNCTFEAIFPLSNLLRTR